MKIRSLENNGKKESRLSRKRSFLMYGVLALVVIAVAAGAVQMLPGGSENSTAAVYTWEGAGTENEPYQINTVQDLANLADDVNTIGTPHTGEWFALMKDLDLSGTEFDSDPGWIPIGSGSSAFYGNLNGNGNTISNLYINDTNSTYSGLFGYIYGSTIENLKLANVNINGGNNVGGVACTANSCAFVNCNIEGTITGSGNVGGMVASTNSGSVENCQMIGSVTGTGGGNVGGLIGFNYGSVENCYNEVDVNQTYEYAPYTGGVIGFHIGGTVRNCQNIGNVTSNGSNVGGVIGFSNSTVENCYASGTVSGYSSVGGVVGQNGAGKVSNCYSTCAVNSTGNYAGGVIGNNGGTVENCYNTGTVDCSGSYAGGVVGYITGGSVGNCYNTGDVTLNGDGYYTGGVVGSIVGGSTVGNCYNTGKVTQKGNGDFIGGVAGNNSGTVENCFNAGDVSGSGDYTGGVAGYNNDGYTIENCFFLKVDGGINDVLSGYFDYSQNGYLNDGAEPKDWEEMHKEITYITLPVADGGWDFVNVWGMYLKNNDPSIPDYGYPYLKTIDNYILVTPVGGSKAYDGNPAPDPGWTTDNFVDRSLFTGTLSYDPTPAIDVNTYNITLGDLDSPFYQLRFDNDIQYQITAASPKSYTITPSSDANSTISPPKQVSVQSGGSMTFAFSAVSGYHISSVMVDGKALTQAQIDIGSYTFTNVNYNRTIDVYSASGPGSGSGKGTSVTLTVDIVGGNGTAEYRIGSEQYVSFTGAQIIPIGSNLYVSVIADSGYSFVEWTGDANSKNTEVNFANVTSDIHLVAHLSNDNATGSAGKIGNFAFTNLILAILALLIGIIAIIAGVWSRKDEEKKAAGTAVIAGLLALIVGIVSIIVFFLTEDMSVPMIATDNWTIWMAVLFVVTVIFAAITFWAGGDRKTKGNN